MYNRYLPQDISFSPVEREPARSVGPEACRRNQSGVEGLKNLPFLNGKEGLGALFSGGEGRGISGLLKALKLENIDAGDVLLLLIILFLLAEGDDLELVIALGLVLLMGLGDEKEKNVGEERFE